MSRQTTLDLDLASKAILHLIVSVFMEFARILISNRYCGARYETPYYLSHEMDAEQSGLFLSVRKLRFGVLATRK